MSENKDLSNKLREFEGDIIKSIVDLRSQLFETVQQKKTVKKMEVEGPVEIARKNVDPRELLGDFYHEFSEKCVKYVDEMNKTGIKVDENSLRAHLYNYFAEALEAIIPESNEILGKGPKSNVPVKSEEELEQRPVIIHRSPHYKSPLKKEKEQNENKTFLMQKQYLPSSSKLQEKENGPERTKAADKGGSEINRKSPDKKNKPK